MIKYLYWCDNNLKETNYAFRLASEIQGFHLEGQTNQVIKKRYVS